MTDFSLPSYDALSDDQVKILKDNSYLLSYKKGDTIFRQNHPISYIMYVTSGLVKLSRENEQERTTILKIAGPDEFLGLLSVFYGNVYQNSASAIEDSRILHVKNETFKEIIGTNGKYALQIMQHMSQECLYLVDKLINISQKQIPGRIASVLLFFSNKVYQNNTFYLPLSRQELAELVSTTKETVSRTLTEFKNDRLIEIKDKQIELISIDLLEMLSKIG